MRKRLVRLLAWAVTAGLLILLFHKIPLSQVMAAARGAAPWTVPAALLISAAVYFCDSFAIWKTFGWFLAPLSFAEILLVRGATYLLAVINYNVGQGAIVYFVHRVARVPVIRGVATVLLIMGINVLALLFLATMGLVAAPAVPHPVVVLVAVAYAGLAVYVVALIARPRWLASRPLFDVLLNAGIGGHLRALAVRLPHIAGLMAFQIVLLRGFGVQVPLIDALAALPVVYLISALPISVQGLGTTQAAMVYFFARFAPGDQQAQQAAVLASSLVGQALAVAFQALLGLFCMRSRVGRALTESIEPTGGSPQVSRS
ncbi:MAG TPA: lysylphosphatidylglycerol synthase domain-containing protein [Polyangia bacterium]|nr:lysylphosphatidylglycerol synthase domain-containing protein [Polyangia bacterium]